MTKEASPHVQDVMRCLFILLYLFFYMDDFIGV